MQRVCWDRHAAVTASTAEELQGGRSAGPCLVGEEIEVAAGGERHDLEPVRLLAHDVQRLRADGAGAAQQREPLRSMRRKVTMVELLVISETSAGGRPVRRQHIIKDEGTEFPASCRRGRSPSGLNVVYSRARPRGLARRGAAMRTGYHYHLMLHLP